MYLKLIGAALILSGCSGYGFLLCRRHSCQVSCLRQLHIAIETMSAELSCRLTPLPELCVAAAAQTNGQIRQILESLAAELDKQNCAMVPMCMELVLEGYRTLPEQPQEILKHLGSALGRFDLDGQLALLSSCADSCQHDLEKLEQGQPQRLRNYKTLSFCAGVALAILLF